MTLKDLEVPQSLVLDLGTATTRYGWSGQDAPVSSLPTVVGTGSHREAMLSLGLQESYVGSEAHNLRGILQLEKPLIGGQIQDFEMMEKVFGYCVENCHSYRPDRNGNSDNSELNILISVSPLQSVKESQKFYEMIYEEFGFKGCFLANKSVMSLYGSGKTTGLCVDSGYDMTYIVPCVEGRTLSEATVGLSKGGKHVTERMLNLLTIGKYSFPQDLYMLLHKKGDFKVVTAKDVAAEAKEKYGYVVGNAERRKTEEVMKLADGNSVVIGNEAWEAPEIMFGTGEGLTKVVLESLKKCDEDLRRKLLGNVVLTGGNTLFEGMAERLENEVARATGSKVKVTGQKGREQFCWLGGSRISSFSSFQRLWQERNDYFETGILTENGF